MVKLRKDEAVDDLHGVRLDAGVVEIALAGAAVEFPGVPGADDGVTMKRAVAEGSASVGADTR